MPGSPSPYRPRSARSTWSSSMRRVSPTCGRCPAILRGKKILVVGDHKQVSPDAGFIAAQRIQELKQRFLAEQPYRDEMTPEKSLYELAVRVYSAANIMLREHFRCVPPIIAYSNRGHYGGQIQPIRIPSASERIDPPLVDIHVPGGSATSATATTSRRRRLRVKSRRCSPMSGSRAGRSASCHCWERSRRTTSTPSSGANVMRASSSADASSAVTLATFRAATATSSSFRWSSIRTTAAPLSGLMFEQRFNVAASRARDRMYLVRSVTAVRSVGQGSPRRPVGSL